MHHAWVDRVLSDGGLAARLLVLNGVKKPVFPLPAACNLSDDLLVGNQAVGKEGWREGKSRAGVFEPPIVPSSAFLS